MGHSGGGLLGTLLLLQGWARGNMAAKAPGAGYVWLPEITVAFHQLQGKEIKFKQRGGPSPH